MNYLAYIHHPGARTSRPQQTTVALLLRTRMSALPDRGSPNASRAFCNAQAQDFLTQKPYGFEIENLVFFYFPMSQDV